MFLRLLKSVLMLAIFASSASHAIPVVGDLDIDFRSSDWSGAYGQPVWEVNGVRASSQVVTGLQATLATGVDNINPVEAFLLYQDSRDGLGIKDGFYEDDEIELDELLLISFLDGETLSGAWVTDLFDAPDGGSNGEDGGLLLFLADQSMKYIEFNGMISDQVNGEQFIDFEGNYDVVSAAFFATDTRGDEFSVAGFVTSVSVPEPGSLGLLGLSFILIGVASRRRSR